ncbi:hypothetical protein HHK36_017487 [Tetracentron sinense]|uniref:Uncharacterized protein n=1 Tax=Tetracentron sinense TaxID=13715 RepID=A0A834Z799_TETSI|nr:hypothetical protein HHK36_017487 [Tetracentron sinense]
MGSKSNSSKHHYDLSMSKRTRKPSKVDESDPQLVTAISPEREDLPLPTGVDEGTSSPERENYLPSGADEGEVMSDHISLMQMINGDGEGKGEEEVEVVAGEGEGEAKGIGIGIGIAIAGKGEEEVKVATGEAKVMVGEGDIGEVIVGEGEEEGERILLKAVMAGDGEVLKRREGRNMRGGNSLGHHFTEEKQQLQLVIKQQGDGVAEGKKLSGMVSRYVKVLSHLIKVKRDPRLGSRKKPLLQLTM